MVAWREEIARVKRRAYLNEEYWGKPVPGFGNTNARILVVGLAPGAHGSNRTGRMFTGDASGDVLFRSLHKFGFASQPVSHYQKDGLTLHDMFISAICRCVPPGNKPTPQEITNCMPYLGAELAYLEQCEGIVVLGRIAYDGIVRVFSQTGIDLPRNEFSHGNLIRSSTGRFWVLQSYHPSRQNTQTGRLTEDMFNQIWATAEALLYNHGSMMDIREYNRVLGILDEHNRNDKS